MNVAEGDVEKPRLRGVLHQVASPIALVAGCVLAAQAPTTRASFAALGFTFALVLLFTVSATYHRVTWSPVARARMRRADHASIFVLIAGTYTPIAMVGLPEALGDRLLLLVWSGAALGVAQTLFWIRAPKVLTVIIALACGWCVVPYWSEARAALSDFAMLWLAVGGVVYSGGALFYAAKRPNPLPGVFGYHEMFHACTIIAAVMHFASISSIVMSAR